MSSLYILLPIALVFFALICAAFIWAVNHRQFDDLDREARRILFDKDPSESTRDRDERD